MRHNLSLSGVYELPFGKGKRLATGRAATALLGGWQINILSRFSTATPVAPTAPGTVLNAPVSSQFADCLGPVAKIAERPRWWDKASLADPNAVPRDTPRFGACGIGVLSARGLINLDAGVFRRFSIGERYSVQIRGEAFNVSNTPHFANPNTDTSSSNFGIIGNAQNTGREGNNQRLLRIGVRIGFERVMHPAATGAHIRHGDASRGLHRNHGYVSRTPGAIPRSISVSSCRYT